MSYKLINLKSKIIEYIKFNIIGFCNFFLSQLIYLFLLLKLHLNYIIAYTIVSLVSITVAYFFNSKFTFKENRISIKKFFLTSLIYIFEYILNLGIIICMVKFLNLSKIIAPILAPAFTTPIIFFLMRYVIKQK